eukprot:jgi/Botrbrau1/18330/Bobra.0179s0057.1
MPFLAPFQEEEPPDFCSRFDRRDNVSIFCKCCYMRGEYIKSLRHSLGFPVIMRHSAGSIETHEPHCIIRRCSSEQMACPQGTGQC